MVFDKHNPVGIVTGMVAERRNDVLFPRPVIMPAAAKAYIPIAGLAVVFVLLLGAGASALLGWKPRTFFFNLPASFLFPGFSAELWGCCCRGNPEQAYAAWLERTRFKTLDRF